MQPDTRLLRFDLLNSYGLDKVLALFKEDNHIPMKTKEDIVDFFLNELSEYLDQNSYDKGYEDGYDAAEREYSDELDDEKETAYEEGYDEGYAEAERDLKEEEE